MSLASDFCLATVTNKKFNCVSRNITVSNGWIRVPINSTGVYAFIFNPMMALKTGPIVPPKPTITTTDGSTEIPTNQTTNPVVDPGVIDGDCTSFGCVNKKWIIIGSSVGGSLIIIITALIVYCCCIKEKTYAVIESQPVP